ncbi:hypothetical protein BTO05_03735 [Winogradskyella sp. PC-19]|uniref:fibrobacter succinogenes major paralogous domain-containing protein n=1 Tax=unclassified Winogradskyella TaxID=2615021 RepID=UPI000B3D47D3|nr:MULTISPECIES: fibrobacter succinogenes major paralogous domain-containing protein [unclassified Winogradskyella]ARV08791.1 hypothetical protein BTO05_03735 [Winogradskyella sp. PC-19]
MKKNTRLLLIFVVSISVFQCSESDDSSPSPTPIPLTVTDIDGNVYSTIKIGNQTWMAENLEVTRLNDGTPITKYTFEDFGSNWGSINNQVAHYQFANTADLNNIYDEELPEDFYGAMYNHFAVETGKLAPDGWRIPTEADFIALEQHLNANGFSSNIAAALKSDNGWDSFSGNGSNASSFNGLPNGYVSGFGTPTASEAIASWLTTNISDTDNNSSTTRRWVQLTEDNSIFYSDTSIVLGAAIRCIKID